MMWYTSIMAHEKKKTKPSIPKKENTATRLWAIRWLKNSPIWGNDKNNIAPHKFATLWDAASEFIKTDMFKDIVHEVYRNKSEEKSKLFRRSIFAVKNIKKGEKFSKNNIKRIRPGYGLPPMYYEKLINKKSPFNLYAENPLKKNILKKLKIL